MDDIITLIGKEFSFTEILCFCLLWRIENKLAATVDAINKFLSLVEKDIVTIKDKVDALYRLVENHCVKRGD